MKYKKYSPLRIVLAALLLPGIMILTVTTHVGLKAQDDSAQDELSIVSGDSVELNRAQGTAYLQGNVYVEHRSTKSTLNSETLFFKREPDTNEIQKANASGNVKISLIREPEKSDPSEMHIFCDKASLKKELKRIELLGSVKVESNEGVIRAEKVTYNYQTHTGKITELPGKQVEMIFFRKNLKNDNKNSANSSNITANATEILVNRNTRKITFQGDVSFKNPVEKYLFEAERAIAFLSEQDELETVVASGEVHISQPDRNSSADRAVFNYSEQTVSLFGNAVVKEKNQLEIRSQNFKMYMNVDKGMVESADNKPQQMNIKVK